MEPTDHKQIPDDIEIPMIFEIPGGNSSAEEHDPEFESGIDILEHKELCGAAKWSPVVICGGRDSARRLVLVASNDDLTVSRAAKKAKRRHGRGLRGPMRWKR